MPRGSGVSYRIIAEHDNTSLSYREQEAIGCTPGTSIRLEGQQCHALQGFLLSIEKPELQSSNNKTRYVRSGENVSFACRVHLLRIGACTVHEYR